MASEVFVLSRDQDETAFIKNALRDEGCVVRSSTGVSSALRAFRGSELIFLSLDGRNAETLREIKSYLPESVILVADAPESAPRVIKEGAHDFIEKPLNPSRLSTTVRNALRYITYREELHRLKSTEAPQMVPSRNRKMLKAMQQAERAASKNAPVLVIGEAGTGKEAIARTIHFESARAAGPFVIVAEAASKGETGLFGRATTKGVSHGAIMSASGGTIFLENVELLVGELAKKLASFVKDGKFVPEGGSEALRADVRVICSAASMDAQSLLYKSFRSRILLPSLRERREDIAALAENLMKDVCSSLKVEQKKFSKDAKEFLLEHAWPGNAGELKNAITKACLLSSDSTVERRHLASGGAAYCSVREFLDDKLSGYLKGLAKIGGSGLYDTVTSEVEKALIELALKETGGNQLKAAKVLGLNRNTLRARIKLYKIKNSRKAKA